MRWKKKILPEPRETGLVVIFFFVALVSASPAAIRFTEVGQALMVRGFSFFAGHGAAWVDVNRDGRLDLYVKNVSATTVPNPPDILYINYGTYFSDEAPQRGVADAYAEGTHGAVFVDFDKDRDLDLFASTTYGTVPGVFNHLYRNGGNGAFQDYTSSIIPAPPNNTTTRGVAAGDFDRDGDIDFYFSNPLSDPDPFNPNPSPPQSLPNFLINNGDGTFTLSYRGIDWTGFTQGVTAADFDNDGDIDLAEARWAPPSTIYRNDGTGNFRNVGGQLGVSVSTNVIDNGIAFADLDNDGDMDLAIIGESRVALYRNTGTSYLRYEVIRSSRTLGCFHCCIADFDNDGVLELYLSGENVYENDGEGHFTVVPTASSGLAASLTTVDPRGCAAGDYDNDGDVDIYLTDKRAHNLLFRNDLNNSDWIQVEIVGDHTGSIAGLGTKVDLYAAGHLGEKAFLKGHREIQGEYGYLGQDMPIAHFGAPSAGGARYDLRVTFLDGRQKIFQNLTPGQRIQVAVISPPLNFQGVKKENKALFYRESLIELSWEPNPLNSSVQMYRIYQAQPSLNLLTEVPGNQFEWTIRNVNKTQAYRFAVTAVDDAGSESEPAYTVVNGNGSAETEKQRGVFRTLKLKGIS
jgi:hypothetical protein